MEFVRKNVNASSGTSSSNSGGIQTTTTTTTANLATHTIFGLPFNGTLDVRGDLSDVSKITANGDVSTDGKYIIKETDDDNAYTGKDLQISKDDSVTKFEGGEAYNFDAEVTASKFNGDVKAETVTTDILNTDALSANDTETNTLDANVGNIHTLLSDNATIDYLNITKAAHFFSLIIDEIKSVGGLVIISPANATLDIVKKTDSGNYKCYFQSKVGVDDRVSNQFAPNDLVVCQTFNVAEGTSYDVSNTFYWRLLTSRGKETIDNVEYHYIILSGTDCAEGSGEPKVGDRVVALGNRNTKDRQNAIVLSAYNSEFLDSGLKAPSLVQYSGINDYTLTTHRLNVISNGLNQFIGNFSVSTGEAVTDLIDATKYNRLILDKATAVVGADSTLTVEISGSVIPVSGKKYAVEVSSDLGNGTSMALTDNTFSYSKEYEDYSSGDATYFTVSLRLDGTIIEKVNVPVIFETGAVLNVMDDKIESAVLGLEGEISTIEQTANSLTTTVQNMKVGGKNLLDDSEFSTYATGKTWTTHNGLFSKSCGYKGLLGVHLISKPSTVNSGGYIDLAGQPITLKLEPDTYYTLSFYAKGANGLVSDSGTSYRYKGRVTTYVYPDVGTELTDNAHTFTTTSKWQRYSYTFKTLSTVSPTSTYKVLFRLITDTSTNNVTYYSNTYICMPKLEEGTMATAWDTSEEDMKSYITQKADSIEAKIVSEDTVKSLISQNSSEIKAEVYDEMSEATGIDIVSGSITLNADKTTINGNLNIRNTDEGLVIYDSDGNAKVMVVNKLIPTLDNLDTSQSQMQCIYDFVKTATGDNYLEYESLAVAVGTYKVGDTFNLAPSHLMLSYNNKFVELSNSVYYQYSYCLMNKTTGEIVDSTTYKVTQTGSWETSGNTLNGYSYTIKTAGVYTVNIVVSIYNVDLTKTYSLGWLVGTEKKITDYTLIGTDGIVSVKGENQYMYYGDDGFIVRGYDYSGFKVNNRNHLKTVISYNSGNTLWGNLNSNLSVININGTATIPTMTVKAGSSTIGSRYVIRADSTYYEADVIVLKSLSGETWIKLPPPITVDGVSYSFISGKSLKIKNLTSQKCYVYCESEPIYAPDGTGSAYYYSIGNLAAEFVWDGTEWIWFRNN